MQFGLFSVFLEYSDGGRLELKKQTAQRCLPSIIISLNWTNPMWLLYSVQRKFTVKSVIHRNKTSRNKQTLWERSYRADPLQLYEVFLFFLFFSKTEFLNFDSPSWRCCQAFRTCCTPLTKRRRFSSDPRLTVRYVVQTKVKLDLFSVKNLFMYMLWNPSPMVWGGVSTCYVPGWPSLRLKFHSELREGRVVKQQQKKRKKTVYF